VARQAAWLRAHHPEAFLAGLLEHGLPPQVRHGLLVLPADVNASGTRCRLERTGTGTEEGRLGVRLALSAIRGLSAGEAARLVQGQPYADAADVLDRAGISPAALRRLAGAGALGSLSRGAAHHRQHGTLLAHLASAAPSRGAAGGPRAVDGQLALEIGGDAPAAAPAPQA
jgi:error-prone DNA polymerase